MKKFFKAAGILACIIVAILYIGSALTPYIPPSSFSLMSFFALAFPWVCAAMLLLLIITLFISRKIFWLLLLVSAVGYKNILATVALHVNSNFHNQKDPHSLRILTWNVLNFLSTEHDRISEPEAWKLYIEKIGYWNPDVICFQEYKNVVLPRKFYNIDLLLDSLGYKYRFASNDETAGGKNWKAFYGCAIYSKLPLADTVKLNINSQNRVESLLSADLIFKNRRLRIFTSHLASFSLYGTSNYADKNMYKETLERKRSILHKIRDRELLHERQVEIIREQIDKSPYPVVYCGDMNSTPASYTYHSLKQNLQDAFLRKNFGFGRTFYKLGPTLRIDACFVDRKFEVVQNSIPGVFISDHFPMLTDVQWKE